MNGRVRNACIILFQHSELDRLVQIPKCVWKDNTLVGVKCCIRVELIQLAHDALWWNIWKPSGPLVRGV
jgi:hypothetical protein